MGIFRRAWQRFTTPARRLGAGVLVVAGLVVGVAFAVTFDAAVEYTNSTRFCTACHQSLRWVTEEWRESVHYNKATGFRAECKDCHVPEEFWPKMWRKFLAYNDVLQEIRGTIDTREKFDERRPLLAQRVWDYMEARDSQECRNCHMEEIWDSEAQSVRAQREHEDAEELGKTCVDCHRGVAHAYPKEEPEEEDFDLGF